MGRERSSPPKDGVNPLQRMFGTFLRLERTQLGYSSDAVAKRLGVTDTYLRLVESGRAALNQSRALKIIEVFAASSAPTHQSRTISFNRLALFMVGMHWLSAEMALNSEGETGERAAEELATHVSDFQIFFERTKKYFELEPGSAAQREFLEQRAAPEVGDFLRLDNYGQTGGFENLIAARELLELPTLNIEIILNLKRTLTGRSFVHTAEVASRWETEQASQFYYERGVYQDSNLIVNQKNLAVFHYDHLFEETFQQVQMVFMNAIENRAKLKHRFVTILNANRRRLKLKELTDKEIKKVEFVCLTTREQEQHKGDLSELRQVKGKERQAYWSFEMRTGLHIGFVGVSNDDPHDTWNLSLRDAIDKAERFNALWAKVSV